MLTIETRLSDRSEKPSAYLKLTFDDRKKSRLRCMLTNGQEVGLFLPHGQPPLQNGEFLQASDGTIIEIIAEKEILLHVTCRNPFELMRVAYHLGNRHVAVQLGTDWIRLFDDYVIKDMLLHLGATVQVIEDVFNPEKGAYASGHNHNHDHSHSHDKQHHEHEHHHHGHNNDDREFSYAPKIHEYNKPS